MKFLLGSMVLVIGSWVSAGELTVDRTLQMVAEHPTASYQLMSLLTERNLTDRVCDVQYHQESPPQIHCNADDNSVLVIFDLMFPGGQPSVEHRENQQVDPGIGPIQ